MLFDGRFKLVLDKHDGTRLFDLVDDPDECTDCTDSHPDIVANLARLLRSETGFPASEPKTTDSVRADLDLS